MTYEDWLKEMPTAITADALWQMNVYRQALFVGDLAWFDVTKLMRDGRTLKLAAQLYDAMGGISATIAEGYSRASDKDQARFYEFALGSARESRDWYWKGRHILGQAVVTHRIQLLVHITRQLLKMIPSHRGKKIAESREEYSTLIPLEDLLANVPMPSD